MWSSGDSSSNSSSRQWFAQQSLVQLFYQLCPFLGQQQICQTLPTVDFWSCQIVKINSWQEFPVIICLLRRHQKWTFSSLAITAGVDPPPHPCSAVIYDSFKGYIWAEMISDCDRRIIWKIQQSRTGSARGRHTPDNCQTRFAAREPLNRYFPLARTFRFVLTEFYRFKAISFLLFNEKNTYMWTFLLSKDGCAVKFETEGEDVP